jgi:serine protease AprX
MDAAAEILWFNGIVVVTSAGNKGSGGEYNTVNAAPANDPFLITVGASNEFATADRTDDAIASFSAFGTTGDGFVKPDVVAPGKDIISVLASASDWYYEQPDRAVLDKEYFRISGTSMAAPMVTGAVALLLQAEPELTPDQVKYRLMYTGSAIPGSSSDPNSYAYLDVQALLTTPTTESANTGTVASQLLWTGDDPITWGSVSWNSVSWNSVSWNSVSWNSVSWNSVSWNSVSWED